MTVNEHGAMLCAHICKAKPHSSYLLIQVVRKLPSYSHYPNYMPAYIAKVILASVLFTLHDYFHSAANSDYNAAVIPVVFPTGENETSLQISIVDDSVYEGSEYFTVGLRTTRSGTGITITQQWATITIVDNDGMQTFTVESHKQSWSVSC